MKGVLLAIVFVTLWCCKSEEVTLEQRYRRSLVELTSATTFDEKLRILDVIQQYWRDKRPDPDYGAGALQLDERERPVLEALHKLLHDDDRLAMLAGSLLGRIRASGHDEELLRCAIDSQGYAGLDCLRALMIIADPRTLEAMVPFMNPRPGEDDRPRVRTNNARSFASAFTDFGARGIPYLEKAVKYGTAGGCRRGLEGLEMLLGDVKRREDLPKQARTIEAVQHGLTREHWKCRAYAGEILLDNDRRWTIRTSRPVVEPLRNDPVQYVRDVITARLDDKPLPNWDDYDDSGARKSLDSQQLKK